MRIVYMQISNLLIRFFAVNNCRISRRNRTRFFFQSLLLQPLKADLVRTKNKYILGLIASYNL